MVPRKPVILVTSAKIANTMYTKNNKKYIDILLNSDDDQQVSEIHKNSPLKPGVRVINPHVRNVLTIKVPWKYDRVACTVTGDKTIQELVCQDSAKISVEYCGVWEVNNCCGPSWKLLTLEALHQVL